jgi:PAS domain S-box-containing protein
MFKAERKDVLGKRPHELSPAFQPNGKRTALMEQEMLQAALAGERQFFEWRHLRKDGKEFDVEVSLNLMELDDEQFVQAILRDITERKQAEEKLAEAYDTTLEGWANALELRDKETKDHSQRVVELTIILAQAMGIEGDELIHIRRGAILHDIGKMGIPDEILRKPGKLTISERKLIEKHPIYSSQLLSGIPYLKKAMDIPYCHHERWDGKGYPQGLKGEEIPLTARIFAVIDVWDALLSDRPYGKAWSREEVIAHIRDESGKHFDPEVVKVFLDLVMKNKI